MTSPISYTKIIMSVGMIAFAAALVVGGTGAFFSDTESSVGNTFAAGAIDLQIDNSSYGFDWNRPGVTDPTGVWGPNDENSWTLSDLTDQLFFDFHDLKPGDYGEDTISLHIDNNDAYACMAFDLTGTPENLVNEAEEDTDNTAGVNDGELQNYLSFLFWMDDGDNVLEVGEEVIDDLSGLSSDIFTGEWLAIADGDDDPLPAETIKYLGKGWCFGDITETPAPVADNASGPTPGNTGFSCTGAAGDHNDAQTDGIEVDVSFYAVQSRNNDDFSCAALPPLGGGQEEGRPVGAVLSDYVAPSCDATVSGTESIQTALTAALVGETVCVAGDYDGTGDNVALRMETTGVTLAALTQGILLDVPVVLSADGVTVTGFEGTIGQAESPAEQAAFYFDNDATNASLTYSEVSGVGAGAAVLTESGADNSGGLIENNVFAGAVQGMYLNPHTGSIMIRYNDFSDNVVAIAGLNGAIVVANEFTHTVAGSEAIGVDSTFDANTATVNQNNFLDDSRLNTYTVIAGTIDAENNYWSPNGAAAQVDQTGGIVDFTPEALVQFPHN